MKRMMVFLVVTAAFIFTSCGKKYDTSINYLVNGDLSISNGIEWWNYSGASHTYKA